MGLFGGKTVKVEGDSRSLKIKDAPVDENDPDAFIDNSIRTSHYTMLNFVPKNLIEQFGRIANFYFAVVIALEYFPFSPLSATVSVLPLAFVLSVTLVREGFEDRKRHKSDSKINNSTAKVLRNDWEQVYWKDIQVGDIVRLERNDHIPADLVILSTSEPQGMAYIDTCNLDGETNLKVRQAHIDTNANRTTEELKTLVGAEIMCDLPNNNLETFNGSLQRGTESKISLSNTQVCLRGCILKNTEWINGVVIYTGQETKLMMNANEAVTKHSSIEHALNNMIYICFAFLLLIGIIGSIMGGGWQKANQEIAWYMDDTENDSLEAKWQWVYVFQFFSYIILLNVFIPISLYVTIEIVKMFQSFFVEFDVDIYHEETDTPTICKTSNLMEELGLIEYIFSDKTGTLTRNVMEFMKCTINGKAYGEGVTEVAMASARRLGKTIKVPKRPKDAPAFFDKRFDADRKGENKEHISEFLRMMALCHTVIVEKPEDWEEGDYSSLVYQAASPDEGALVSAARDLDYVFIGRTPTTMTIVAEGEEEEYEILNVLEFNSTRKRMSIILRDPKGRIVLYTKGADNVIFERLKPDTQDELAAQTLEDLEVFAGEGLRTLCFAMRVIPKDEYDSWAKEFHEANTSIKDRAKKLDRVSEMIEKDLMLVGASAIEDKLQEGVPQTIANLAKAGIKIWVLTGDKQETAINIGFACSLLTSDMELIILSGETAEEMQKQLDDTLKKEELTNVGIIINGKSLRYCLEDPSLKRKLYDIAKDAKAVVCCRVSPLQKSLVVEMVREYVDGVITLAIGDGANDVSMIQSAHVGVGISGQEGMQAVMASDYAIAQFRFLRDLLLVHGRWNLRRVANLIVYSFYKNVAFSLIQLLYGIFAAWSAQTLFPTIMMSVYNVIWTSVPIVVLGVFDQDVSKEAERRFPQLYSGGNRENVFTYSRFVGWLAQGFFHASVIFFVPYMVWRIGPINKDGLETGLWELSIMVYSSVVVVVNLKVAIETVSWTWIHHVAIWGSIASWFLVVIPYSRTLLLTHDVYMVCDRLFTNPVFYITLLLVASICAFPDLVAKYVRRAHYPLDWHLVQEYEKLGKSLVEAKAPESPAADEESDDGTGPSSGQSSSSSTESEKKSEEDRQRMIKEMFVNKIRFIREGKETVSTGFAFNPDKGASSKVDASRTSTLLFNPAMYKKNLEELERRRGSSASSRSGSSDSDSSSSM